jgi:hypothetical protein
MGLAKPDTFLHFRRLITPYRRTVSPFTSPRHTSTSIISWGNRILYSPNYSDQCHLGRKTCYCIHQHCIRQKYHISGRVELSRSRGSSAESEYSVRYQSSVTYWRIKMQQPCSFSRPRCVKRTNALHCSVDIIPLGIGSSPGSERWLRATAQPMSRTGTCACRNV